MDIRTFVKEALTQIIEGVAEAQRQVDPSHGVINPPVGGTRADDHAPRFPRIGQSKCTPVSFDLAVTVSESSERSAGGTISVAWIAGISGGGNKASKDESVAVNRIAFQVPIAFAPRDVCQEWNERQAALAASST